MTSRARRTPTRDRQGGYLLIEALVTLALSALVLVGLIQLTSLFLRSSDRTAAGVEALETWPRTMDAMAREIRRAVRQRWPGPGDRLVFLGLPDRVVFAIAPMQTNGLRAPVAVAYQAAEQGVALRAEAPITLGASQLGDLAFGPPIRLPIGAETLRFAYVDRVAEGGEVTAESWSKPNDLPFAIRIDRVNPSNGVLIASLRVPVIVDAEPSCASPEAARCSRTPKKAEDAKPAGGPTNEPAGAPETAR